MSRPDGIPEDVWELAGDCVKQLRLPDLLDQDFASKAEMDRVTMEIVGHDGVVIARAIMAEREACADYHDDKATEHEASRHEAFIQHSNGMQTDFHEMMARVHRRSAAAIRNRGA